MQHLTKPQQDQFTKLFNALEQQLGSEFEASRDTFMIEPLRYSQSAFFPVDKTMSRAAVIARIEPALRALGLSFVRTRVGEGVYTNDLFNIGYFMIKVCCARRGGKMIGFIHPSDVTS